MEKAQKAEVVKGLQGLFGEAGTVVVAHYSGMTVAEMGDLRARARKAGASFKVAKNRLAMRALEGTPVAGIAALFKGPTGIAFSKDPVAAAKVVVAYAKDNDQARDPGRRGGRRSARSGRHQGLGLACRLWTSSGPRSWVCLQAPQPRSPASCRRLRLNSRGFYRLYAKKEAA